MNKGKLHALGCGGLVEERSKGTDALLLPAWVPVQGERAWEKKKKKKREREAGKESEQSGTRRNWLSSEGYWVARPAKPRGGIFKCFSPLYLFTPDVNVAGVNMSSVQLAEKSDSHLGPGLATTPFPVLCK